MESPTVDVFVSYAREDLHAARRLVDGLKAAGRSVWVDLEGLYAGEAWWPSLCRAIDASHAVVFLISPHSAASAACRAELDHAEALGKRIVPVLWQDPDAVELPPVAQRTQWLLRPGQDIDGALVAALVAVLDADPAWVRGHTRWTQLAAEWDQRGRPDALLVRGDHLDEALGWLAGEAPARDPAVTPAQRAFIAASRLADGLSRARALVEADRPEGALSVLLEAGGPLDAAGHGVLFEALQRLRRCEPLRPRSHHAEQIAAAGASLVVAGDVDRASVWDVAAAPADLVRELEALGTDLPRPSPDGRRLVGPGPEGLALWDTTTWTPIADLGIDAESVDDVAFSLDGQWLAAADDTRIRLLRAEDGRVRHELERGASIAVALAFDPTGRFLLSRGSDRLRLWSIESGQAVWSIAAGTRSSFWSAHFSSDGRAVAAARGNRRITVWDAADGRPIRTLVGPEAHEYQDCWFVAADRVLLAFDGLYTHAWPWPAGKGTPFDVGRHSRFEMSPSGTSIALSSGDRSGRIELRDVTSGALIETLRRHEGEVTALAWTPDGEVLVSGHENGMLVHWAMSTRSVHGVVDTRGGRIGRIRVLPDGRGVAATGVGDGGVRVWRFGPSLALRDVPGRWWALDASAEAAAAAAVERDSGGVRMLDGECLDVRGRAGAEGREYAQAVFSPDGRRLAAVGRDGRLDLFDAESLSSLGSWPAPARACVVSWAASGERLLVRGESACAVLGAADGAVLLAIGTPARRVEEAALSPDGRRLFVAEILSEVRENVSRSLGHAARLIDVDSGATLAPVAVHEDPTRQGLRHLSFGADGATCLAVQTTDGAATLIDAASGAVIRRVGGVEQRQSLAAWLPDGRRILTATSKAVTIWAVDDGRQLATHAVASVRAVVFSPDRRLAATVGSHAVHVWHCETWTPLVNLCDGIDRFPERAAFTASGDGLVIVETDGRSAWYPVGQDALRRVARPWIAALAAAR
ncbi:MAG: TIR domain-containing protein [Vicinamibacterales bacterium]